MPLPRPAPLTAEQMERRQQTIREAMAAGAIQNHERSIKYAPNGTERFELICFTRDQLVHPRTFQPITVAEWMADCHRRNVIPYVPNQ